VNFVLNTYAVRENSKLLFIRATVSKINIIPKQVLLNKS